MCRTAPRRCSSYRVKDVFCSACMDCSRLEPPQMRDVWRIQSGDAIFEIAGGHSVPAHNGINDNNYTTSELRSNPNHQLFFASNAGAASRGNLHRSSVQVMPYIIILVLACGRGCKSWCCTCRKACWWTIWGVSW